MKPELLAALASEHLVALACLPADPAFCHAPLHSLILIGPAGGAAYWQHVTRSPEWRGGQADPVDRWSHRILGGLAQQFDGSAMFPSDGPPYPPFLRWAQQSGMLWQSPVGMLVHADTGLWVSFRGALAVPFEARIKAAPNPCITCEAQPCRKACPVSALSLDGYDVAACRAHLDTNTGKTCLSGGCLARAACPASQRHARLPEHSAYHMSRFHI